MKKIIIIKRNEKSNDKNVKRKRRTNIYLIFFPLLNLVQYTLSDYTARSLSSIFPFSPFYSNTLTTLYTVLDVTDIYTVRNTTKSITSRPFVHAAPHVYTPPLANIIHPLHFRRPTMLSRTGVIRPYQLSLYQYSEY